MKWKIIAIFLIAAFELNRAQDNFYFSTQPKDANVISEQSTTLECNVSNRKHIIFYWQLNGEPVTNTTRRYQEQSNLHITRVDREKDSGEFKCIAMNATTGFSLFSSGASLNIMWIDEVVVVQLQTPSNEDEIKEGDELILKCKVDGNPEMHIEWYRNSVRLFRNNQTTIRNKRLHLFGISARDNGVYSCRASNDAGAVDSSQNFALILPHPLASQITQLPQDLTVKKNDPAMFDCVYKDAAITEWYMRDEGPLTNSSRLSLFPNGSLFIHRVRGSDEGLYKCVGVRGISKDEPIQTYTAELRIAVLGEMDGNTFEPSIDTNQLMIVAENKDFEMTCIRPTGYPRPHMWWEDPRGKVISDTGRIRVDETRLIITSTKHEDAGNYTCVAENLANRKQHYFQLFVSTMPSIASNPISITVEEGERSQLYCEFKGSPYPVTMVTWLKDEKHIRDDNFHYVIHRHNGTLQIMSVQLSDNGSYTCEVNTTGFPVIHSRSAVLSVKEKLKFVPAPVNKKLELNASAKIPCKSRGAAKPLVRWMKKGQPMFEWPSHIRDENGTLYFDTVKPEDAGQYTCVATNFQGVINVTIQIEVIVTPKFVVKPSNVRAVEGYPTMIHCRAYGDPPPTIQWDKNSVMNGFDLQRFSVMDNGTLFVSEVHMDDQGKYGCTAGNSGGFKREEIVMVVRSAENYTATRDLTHGRGERQEENMMTKTVTITLSAATAYMVLVVGLMMWCRYRRAKRKAAYLQESSAEVNKTTENGDIPNGDAEMKDRTPNSVKEYKDNTGTKSDEAQSHSSVTSHHSKRNRSSYDHLQFPRHDVQTVMLLGKGEFGEVFLAKAHGIHDGETETVVMVKSLQSREDGSHFHFKREMDMYSKMSHEHIARLLGMCREAEPHFMIMEYSDWGDLKQFLLATRKENPRKSPRPPQLSPAQIVSMCSQIAQGMEYLSNHRYIHRDLAARNCLVTSKLDIKISNSCLCRDTYASEYFSYRNRLLPLRWMPAEAVFEDDFSTKSDVWAFGVLIWELCTQAEFPHADKSDEVYMKHLKAHDITWLMPEECPKSLQSLPLKCWSQSPKDRPTFSDLVVSIGDINIDSKV